MYSKYQELQNLLLQEDFTTRDITFLFSELRKIIEKDKLNSPTLKFYLDWSLHPQKDYFNNEVKLYLNEIYCNAVKHIKNPLSFEYLSKIKDLIYFEVLKLELKNILIKYELSHKMLEGEVWLNFVRALVKLLEEQPLVKPVDEIEEISFIPANSGAAVLIIRFTEPVTDRKNTLNYYYKIGNYY